MNLIELNNKVKNNPALLLDKIAVTFNVNFPKSYLSFSKDNNSMIINCELKQSTAKPTRQYYTAKSDYLNNQDEVTNTQVVNEIVYELNSKLINTINDNAPVVGAWSKDAPRFVDRRLYYASILESIEQLNSYIFSNTCKYFPNYYIVSPDVYVILRVADLIDTSKADIAMNGPYLCGHLTNGKPVYCAPNLTNKIIGGVITEDTLTSSVLVGIKGLLVQKTRNKNNLLSSKLDFKITDAALLGAVEIV